MKMKKFRSVQLFKNASCKKMTSVWLRFVIIVMYMYHEYSVGLCRVCIAWLICGTCVGKSCRAKPAAGIHSGDSCDAVLCREWTDWQADRLWAQQQHSSVHVWNSVHKERQNTWRDWRAMSTTNHHYKSVDWLLCVCVLKSDQNYITLF